MSCIVCGNEDFEIYADENMIVRLCDEHKNKMYDQCRVAIETPKCKDCAYVARCCRTRQE